MKKKEKLKENYNLNSSLYKHTSQIDEPFMGYLESDLGEKFTWPWKDSNWTKESDRLIDKDISGWFDDATGKAKDDPRNHD
jgi:hypothetical protein